MSRGKHASAKKVKNRRNNRPQMEDIYSSSKRKNGFAVLTRIVLIIQVLAMAACTVYVAMLDLIPLKYLIALGVVEAFICGMQFFITAVKLRKRKNALRVISIFLTVIIFVVSYFGVSYLDAFHSSVDEMTESEEDIEVAPNAAEVTDEPFFIYLSGSDTRQYSNIPEKGLSDVNMVIAVDPVNHKILMVNTPRDYYVGLWGDSNKLDKLTHAGNYGIECSMETLEALYDIEFNYYVKVNFKSVVDIVDALGGITVNSEKAFSSRYSLSKRTYSFKVGENHLNGDAALAFARERKSFAEGDRQRGKNQQIVIKAIFDKAISPAILKPSNLKNILSSVSSNTKTNISKREITSLFKMQLNDMSSWDFESVSVDGSGASRSTYSVSSYVYVMIPDETTVLEAKTALAAYKVD